MDNNKSENKIENPKLSIVENLTSSALGRAYSILSIRSAGNFMNGARCLLKINGKIIAFAFQISWDIQTAQDEIYCIDEYLPTELAPKKIRCTGSIGCFRIPGISPSILNIQPNILSFLMHKYISIEVIDKKTGNMLFYASHAVITGRSESVAAEGTANMVLNFQAIGFQDELKPTFQNK